MRIGPATWYSGAPEADGFKHAAPAAALLVDLDGPGAPARVTALPTGSLRWQRAPLDLMAGEDAAAAHDRALPPLADRAQTLFDLVVSGRSLAMARVALQQAAARAAPDFLWHRADFGDLGIDHDSADLDAIDRQGALRAAAEALAREATDPALPPGTRATAQDALSHLFSFAAEA